MRSFVKMKSSGNGEITLLFTDLGQSCPSGEFLASQICLLRLFAKIIFLRKFPDLQYWFIVLCLCLTHRNLSQTFFMKK